MTGAIAAQGIPIGGPFALHAFVRTGRLRDSGPCGFCFYGSCSGMSPSMVGCESNL